ncbi:hypothetical protein ACFFRR_000481 [Megaselia abdita]
MLVFFVILLITKTVYVFEVPMNILSSRIVGGSAVKKPVAYQVSLQYKRRAFFEWTTLSFQNWDHFCGGSIIAENFILTAAHCLAGFGDDFSKISVLAGTTKRSSGGTRHYIDKTKSHEKFLNLVSNDIAVIKLKTPIRLDNKTRGAIEIEGDQDIDGEIPVILTGWGFSTPIRIGVLPQTLQVLNYTTISNQKCKEEGFNVSEREVCASKGFLKGACAGDSGGPLVTADRSQQIGVVSYGTRLCAIGLPDAFTRVSKFVDWIKSAIASLQ